MTEECRSASLLVPCGCFSGSQADNRPMGDTLARRKVLAGEDMRRHRVAFFRVALAMLVIGVVGVARGHRLA